MNRRTLFRRSALILPALIVGDAALEAMERLAHSKVFALGGLPPAQWHEPIGDFRTMADLAKHYDSDEKLKSIVVLLNRSNRYLMELPWKSVSS